MKKLSERKRDILILLIVVLISCPISYFMKDVGNVWDQPFSFIWYAFLVFTCFQLCGKP